MILPFSDAFEKTLIDLCYYLVRDSNQNNTILVYKPLEVTWFSFI